MKVPTLENVVHSAAVDTTKAAMEPVYRLISASELWKELRALPRWQKTLAVLIILVGGAILKENLPKSTRFRRFLKEVAKDIPSELLDALWRKEST